MKTRTCFVETNYYPELCVEIITRVIKNCVFIKNSSDYTS